MRGLMLATALLGLMGAGVARAECKIDMLAELPIHMKDGVPRVTIQVNGHDADALVATGSQQSVVRTWSAKRLGVFAVNVDAEMSMKARNDPARAAELDTVQLGKLTLKKVPIFVAGNDRQERGDEDMVLGANFFEQADVEFDLPHGMLRVLRPNGCKDDEVLYWGGAYSVAPIRLAAEGQNEPRLEVKLNGHSFEALLASNEFASYVSSGAAQQAGSKPAPGATKEWELLRSKPRQFDSFTIDQETLKNVIIDVVQIRQVFSDNPTNTHLAARYEAPPMVLGADFLSAHRLLISNSQHRIYFTYEGGPVFKPSTPAEDGK